MKAPVWAVPAFQTAGAQHHDRPATAEGEFVDTDANDSDREEARLSSTD